MRGLDLHESVFGVRPRGVWPSEGSVSEEVLSIAHRLGVKWMATDEGVLGRSLGLFFSRDGDGRLSSDLAHRLYTIYRYEKADTRMNLIFRDHTLSDLIGFVYSGMPPQEAANNLIQKIKECAQPILAHGHDAMVPIILDGENAWEYYPKSGREFLRRFYDGLAKEPEIEAVTVSDAIARHQNCSYLNSLVPGSWINANFNVWIGAPEDNKAWDYLYQARNLYTETAASATEPQRKLAFEELLIAEGSDWNWWYGPEHHSANDREFDELYRKHLSNVYQALGRTPPDYLAQPIAGIVARPYFTAQSAYIHPRITGDMVRYFEWMGAARYTADRRSGSMHGKQFLLDAVYAGIDEKFVYGRLDFAGCVPEGSFEVIVNLEAWAKQGTAPQRELRLDAGVENGKMQCWKLTDQSKKKELAGKTLTAPGTVTAPEQEVRVALLRNFEFRVPLAWLEDDSGKPGSLTQSAATTTGHLRLRFSLWQSRLPVDALPVEGWIELEIMKEEDLVSV